MAWVCEEAGSFRGDAPRSTVHEVRYRIEKKHYDIINRFGRYPHRNEAPGREYTAEEKEYLESGGEAFGDKAS
jgi:uncharacterized protein (DUF924 family)